MSWAKLVPRLRRPVRSVLSIEDSPEKKDAKRVETLKHETPSPTVSIHTIVPSLGRKAAVPYYITLTITHAETTYVTPILLGNNFPLSTSTPTSDPPKSAAQHPGISTGSIVGIVVGCVLGLGLLLGVLYIYLLRVRQYERVRKKKRSRKGSSSVSGDGPGPGPPPPPPPPPPAAA